MSRHFSLHAAAVTHHSRAHVLACHTTGGKSTLTAYLASRGLGYITDDRAVLDKSSMTILPSGNRINLRDGGFHLLESMQLLHEDDVVYDPTPGLERYVYTPRNTVNEPVALDSIYFIERTEDRNELVPMSRMDAMLRLMESPTEPIPVDGEYIRFIAKLAEYVRGKLYYSDMAYVYSVITDTAAVK